MAYECYTIQQFEDAQFKGSRDVMNDTEFKLVYDEYIDTAGLYDVNELEQLSYIYFINNRINHTKISITLQTKFILQFGEPYKPNVESINKLGYNLTWNKDLSDFLEQMQVILESEMHFDDILANSRKELSDYRESKPKQEKPTEKQSRESWIRMINSLRKIGWKINKDRDTVESLALTIKQQMEEHS